MKQFSAVYKNLLMLSQFGLSFITPLLMCLAACWWLNARMGVGEWVYIIGFFFGMGGSGMVAYKFYLSVMRDHEKHDKKDKISFNRHI